MSHIEQILIHDDLKMKETESLEYIRKHSESAYEGIISGLSAVGNLAFWACTSKDYPAENAKDDLRSLGEMLMHLPGIVAALNINARDSDFHIKERAQK